MIHYLIIPFQLLGWHTPSTYEIISVYPEEMVSAIKVISVKNYPEELQSAYQIFQAKCTACHGAEDSLQSKEVLPSYWETTTQRMQGLKDSNLSTEEASKVADLLIYDSFKRRKNLLDKQLKALPENERAQEQAKLDAVIKKYAN